MKTTSCFPFRGAFVALTAGILAYGIPMYGQAIRRVPIAQPVQIVGSTQGQTTSTRDQKTEARDSEDGLQVPLTPEPTSEFELRGYPTDWTHHRVLFSDPGSEEEAIQKGRHEEWLRVVNDPRYLAHAMRRRTPAYGPASADIAAVEAERARISAVLRQAGGSEENARLTMAGGPRPVGPEGFQPHRFTAPDSEAKEDWNVPLTTGNSVSSETILTVNLLNDSGGQLTGSTLQPDVYPAKYTYNANGTGNCPNDFIVYPTGLPGVTTGNYTVPAISLLGINLGSDTVDGPGTPNIIAYNNLDTGILSGITSCGTILAGVFNLGLVLNQNLSPNPTVMWAYNTGGAVTGSPALSLDGSQIAYIQQTSSTVKTAQLVLLKWSSLGNSGTVSLSVGGLLTVGATEMVNGYEYSYGVANIGLVNVGGLTSNYPAAMAPSSATCASARDAYQLATAGEGTGTAPTPSMCVTTLKKGGSTATTVTHSSPFPDYINGALYVGDDQGYLHMFTGVSFGVPGTKVGQSGSTAAIAEVTPLSLSSYPLGAPAYDNVSGCVFVGDSAGVMYEVNPGFGGGTKCTGSTAALTLYGKTTTLANSTTNGILDAPMVDSNAGAVYAFVSSSSTAGGLTSGSNAIYEFVPGYTGSNATPVASQAVGTGGSTLEFLDGDFDNAYYSSSTGTGNMYVVGNTHTLGNGSLFQIPITNSRMGTAKNLGVLNTASGQYAFSSPVMEFCNNNDAACAVSGGQTTAGLDMIYFSVYKGVGGLLGGLGRVLTTTNCAVTSALLSPGGCIYGVNVSNPASPVLYDDYYTSWAGSVTNPCWSTSGFVVDNADSSILGLNLIGAGSQLYFLGFNGNSDSLLSNYDPCGTSKTTSNIQAAQQIGQGNLSL